MKTCSSSARLLTNSAPSRILVAVMVAYAAWLCWLPGVDSSIASAEETTATASKPLPIAYRRVFVPVDKVDAWPRDGQKYLPVEARDFEKWVEAANQTPSGQLPLATIDDAQYTARLNDDGRLQGQGRWKISVRGDQSAFLPLNGMSLVARDPHWQGVEHEPVRLGTWGHNEDLPENMGLQVPRSGTLEFDWVAPTTVTHDGLEIPWRLPKALSTRVILDLPKGVQPRIDGGAVLDSTELRSVSSTETQPRRRWVLAVNPASGQVLRLTKATQQPTEVLDSAAQLIRREEVNDRITQHGLETTATWHLDGDLHEQSELAVPLPRGMQLESAVANGRELSWRIARGTAPTLDKVLIALPKVDKGHSLQLVLSAWQPLVLDQPWQLPRLRPDNVFWSSGKIELSIAPEFELRSLEAVDCEQTGVSQISAGTTTPEVYWLLAYAPTAAVELTLSRRQPDAAIRAGSSLILADPDVTGRLVTEWNVSRSSMHRLTGELAAGWNIETVETIPADALAEWFVDRTGNRRNIEIQLSDAVSPSRKVSVIIMGRWQRLSLAEPISAATLRIVDWPGVRVARHLLTFQSTAPFVAEPVGDLPVLAHDSLDESDRALLDATSDDARVVDLTHARKAAGLQLTFKRGKYAAVVEQEATYSNEQLRQLIRIAARPQASSIDRLLVYATAPLGDNVVWSETSSNSTIMAERLQADDPQAKALPKDGELWSLRLPQPTSGPVEITATVATSCKTRSLLPLIVLPEAVEQRGRLLVRSSLSSAPSVDAVGLRPTPLSSESPGANKADNAPPVRAAFRFNPTDCLKTSQPARVWIGPATQAGTVPLVPRNLQLESFYWPDGRGTHRATFQFESINASEMKPPLSAEARLLSASVDGKPQDLPTSANNPIPPIHLPINAQSATVSLYFETQQTPLTAGCTRQPPLAQDSLAALAGEWAVWLPEDYSATASNRSAANGEFNWRERLFGPLGRPNSATSFHPLRPADWAQLFNSIVDWRHLLSTPGSAANDASQPSLPGWHAYRESFVAGGPQPIVVLHPSATIAWAVASMLACFLLGRWLYHTRGHGTLLIVLFAIAGSLALLLPAVFSPLATGAIWGLVLALLAEWPRRTIANEDVVQRHGSRIAAAGSLAVLIVVGLTQLANGQTNPAATSAPPPASTPPIERVLIPIDSAGHPAGTKYYVSEQFLRTLLGSASDHPAAQNQWLLRDATYTGELRENMGHADIGPGDWTLAFSIETLARDTTIALPLVRNEAAWQPTAMLDGIPMPLTWRDDGRQCEIQIAEPSRYSLTVYCRPKSANIDGRNQINLSIPQQLAARFQLRFPETLTGVKVAGAITAPSASTSPGALNGELENADRLSVEWPRLESKTSTGQGLSVTEMNWLRVGAAEIELETKYVLEGGARRPEALTIAYDDRWQLVTKAGSSPDDRPRDNSNRRRSIQFPLPAEDIDRQEILVRWRMVDVPSPGNFSLPPIELTSMPATKRWLAVSTDPALECTVTDNTAADSTAKEFLEKWGSTASIGSPQVVLANLDHDRVWTLAVRPRDIESAVHEVLHVAAGGRDVRIAYQANVSPGNAGRYQFRLNVPANLKVDDITLAAADRQIPARWTRESDTRVNVFFGEEVAVDYQLTLIGTLPFGSKRTAPLPRVTTPATDHNAQQVQLYRDDDLEVKLQGLPAAEEARSTTVVPPPVTWVVRPMGIYHLDEAAASQARIIVAENQPKYVGDTLTTLSREAGAWWATIRCRLTVDDGELDTLHLRVPSNWTGPFEIESTVTASSELAPLDEHSQLLRIRLTPTVAKGGEVDLKIRGTLNVSSGAPVAMPDIAPQPLAAGHRYLAVPTSLDSQPIAWTEDGVRPANIPANLLPSPAALATSQKQFEVAQQPFHVAVRSQAAPQPTPRIRLADTAVTAGDQGGQSIATRFIVASDGLAECTLQLPNDQQLISVTLDGRPALTRADDATHWHVALGAAQLPQSLEIVSQSTGKGPAESSAELRRPTLLAGNKPIPVELSLWSFAHAQPGTTARIAGANPVSAVDQAALRFDRLVSIAESATAAAADTPTPDGYNWFRPWAALLHNVQQQSQQIIARPASEPNLLQVSRTSEEQIGRAAKRLETWLQQASEVIVTPELPQPLEARIATKPLVKKPQSPLEFPETTYYVAEGGADRLAVELESIHPSPIRVQVVGLIAIVGLTIVGTWLIRSPAASDFMCRWPHAAGILLGFAYWAWLWPSWLGLIIAASSLILSLRFDWPGRSLRTEASTVLRRSRTN